MKKLFVLFTLALIILPLHAFSQEEQDRDTDLFPLDQGIEWVYDDGNADRIVAISRISHPEKRNLNVFVFDTFNHQKRMFYRLGTKIFELRQNSSRLWYDFGADEGGTWKLEWIQLNAEKNEPDKNNVRENINSLDRDEIPLNDINDGATVTLEEKGLTVKTPMGEFKNVFRFRTSRKDVADAAYVDEFFAPGAGCIMRVWDTIAGPKQQKLARINVPKPELKYRVDVKLDKNIYIEGENIEIEVTVLNWSDKELTLNFPTSLQAGYLIDDVYKWSDGKTFTEAETSVIIPARDVHKWTFTHTPDDFNILSGKHVLAVKLAGKELGAHQEFIVAAKRPPLPEGLDIAVTMTKESCAPGEFIDFKLSVANTTESDIILKVRENHPVKYVIDEHIPDIELLFREIDEPADLTIPAGKTVELNGRHSANNLTIKPGEHILYAGVFGYVGMAKTQFLVTTEISYGVIAGKVTAPTVTDDEINENDMIPLKEARILLMPIMPKGRERELDFMPGKKNASWTAMTDDTGSFQLENVPIGSYFNLTVEKEGFHPYNQTIRFYGEKNILDIVIKPRLEVPDKPLIFHRHKEKGIAVAFGTGSSVYQPNSNFKAFLNITNVSENDVTFTFDNPIFAKWQILKEQQDVVWDSNQDAAEKSTAEYQLTLKPSESRGFTFKGTFKDIVPKDGGKFLIRGILKFTTSSVEGLENKDMSGFVKVLVVPKNQGVGDSQRVIAQTKNKELVVDLREKANAVIDMVMKDENVEGEMQVTEMLKNMHKPKNLHRFVKMVEIDADSEIRDNMEKAHVRIYYNPDDFGEDFDPEKLKIAHWRDNPKLDSEAADGDDSDEEADWEELECQVDTINNCVEAETENFSSFALFEYDQTATSVEDDQELPEQFELSQNSPNPFNPTTLIQFSIPQAGNVRISVYNIMGQEIAQLHNGMMTAGIHRVTFDGRSYASGVYFYRVYGNGFSATKKMLLMK